MAKKAKTPRAEEPEYTISFDALAARSVFNDAELDVMIQCMREEEAEDRRRRREEQAAVRDIVNQRCWFPTYPLTLSPDEVIGYEVDTAAYDFLRPNYEQLHKVIGHIRADTTYLLGRRSGRTTALLYMLMWLIQQDSDRDGSHAFISIHPHANRVVPGMFLELVNFNNEEHPFIHKIIHDPSRGMVRMEMADGGAHMVRFYSGSQIESGSMRGGLLSIVRTILIDDLDMKSWHELHEPHQMRLSDGELVQSDRQEPSERVKRLLRELKIAIDIVQRHQHEHHGRYHTVFKTYNR